MIGMSIIVRMNSVFPSLMLRFVILVNGCSLKCWSGQQDSNLRPPAPKAGALARLRYARMIVLEGCSKGKDIEIHDIPFPLGQSCFSVTNDREGLEQSVCLWCRRGDSNSGPSAYKAAALPAELRRHLLSVEKSRMDDPGSTVCGLHRIILRCVADASRLAVLAALGCRLTTTMAAASASGVLDLKQSRYSSSLPALPRATSYFRAIARFYGAE